MGSDPESLISWGLTPRGYLEEIKALAVQKTA